jgi:hypothetical protein
MSAAFSIRFTLWFVLRIIFQRLTVSQKFAGLRILTGHFNLIITQYPNETHRGASVVNMMDMLEIYKDVA